MKTTVYRDEFHKYFNGSDTYKNQFSYEALNIIFDYIEEYEASTGDEMELDVIGICCEWSEDTPENIAANYSIDIEDDGNALANVLDHLYDETMVAGTTETGTIVFLAY